MGLDLSVFRQAQHTELYPYHYTELYPYHSPVSWQGDLLQKVYPGESRTDQLYVP
jgi:hypothetical protein